MIRNRLCRIADALFLPIAITTIILIFIVTLFIGLHQSIWFDEGYSILLAKHSISDLISLTGVDAHPPFYYLLLKAWTNLFGFSEVALRSLGALLVAASVGVMIGFVRTVYGKRVALGVLPFLVIAPFLIRYGYEIRMYSLASLIAVSATWALFRASSHTKRRYWVVYGLLVVLGMYTLYMLAAVWLAHAIWLLVRTVRARKSAGWGQVWLLTYAGAFLLFLPYVPTLVYQLTHSALPGIGEPVNLVTLAGLLSLLTAYTPSWSTSTLLALGLVAIMCLIVIVTRKLHLQKTERVAYGLLTAVFFGSLLFFAVSSLPKPIFIERYIAHVAIFGYTLLGLVVILALRQRLYVWAGLLGALSGIILILGLGQQAITGNFNWERLQRPETKAVSQYVSCGPTIQIVADDPYTYIDSAYYFDKSNCNFGFFSEEPVARQGGYAPLAESGDRVESGDNVTSEVLYHLHWKDDKPKFRVDTDMYRFVASRTFDKQVVDLYEKLPWNDPVDTGDSE